MTVTAFLILLTIYATITAIFTEAVKKFLDAQEVAYASNILVLAVAIVVGCGGNLLRQLPGAVYGPQQRLPGPDGRGKLGRGNGGL